MSAAGHIWGHLAVATLPRAAISVAIAVTASLAETATTTAVMPIRLPAANATMLPLTQQDIALAPPAARPAVPLAPLARIAPQARYS